MSKYIDADLLRKEINKWTDAMSDNIEDDYSDGVRFALNHFVFILESLQQEQPSLPPNLDEVAKQLYPIITEEAKSDEWKIANREYNDMCIKLQDAFRKGAEWMAKQIKQEQPEVDLEKEIDKFLNETGAPYVWCNDDEQKEWCNIIARHFAEWGAIHLNTRKEK